MGFVLLHRFNRAVLLVLVDPATQEPVKERPSAVEHTELV